MENKNHRITISIPRGLKKRMDMVNGFNWSKIASDAFAITLAKPGPKCMDLLGAIRDDMEITREYMKQIYEHMEQANACICDVLGSCRSLNIYAENKGEGKCQA